MSPRLTCALSALLAFAVSSPVVAMDDPPLKNWSVPSQTGAKLAPLADIGQPGIFVAIAPCRIVDTRGGAPLGGGVGRFSSGETRSYDLNSAGAPCDGIPSGTAGYSLNVSVTNETANGYVSVYPTGNAPNPMVSTVNYRTASAIANATIVPCDTNGSVTVLNAGGSADVFIDINGYFIGGGASLNSGESLYLQGSKASDGILRVTNYDTGATSYGAIFDTRSTGGFAAAVYGAAMQTAATGITYGVMGGSHSPIAGSAGVYGSAGMNGGNGMVYGVYGLDQSIDYGSAGVLGSAGGVTFPNGAMAGTAGVMGTGNSWGVLGKTTGTRAVQGSTVNATTGLSIAAGVLGYSGTIGVYSFNDMAAAGTKPFIEPHPTDPGKQIVYIAMEGNEAGTYFRGRARFQGKTATIDVPEDFRLVTEEEGLTVQITPIGHPTAVAVVSMDLNRIVVEATGDVEFSYLVQGFRHHYRDHQPIQTNTVFVPTGPGARMEPYPAHIQKLLIDLGIYNADGTVNLTTARRLGWDKVWEAQAKGESR